MDVEMICQDTPKRHAKPVLGLTNIKDERITHAHYIKTHVYPFKTHVE